MKIVYIAGPYTAKTWDGIEANIKIAEAHARRIAAAGFGFVCPHLNSRHFEDIKDLSYTTFWLKMYCEILKLCDAVFLLPNWDNSTGTKIEKDLAESLDIPTFASLDKMIKWAKARR